MAERRPRLGVLPAWAFDLRPGPGGASWGFNKPEDRDRVIRVLGAERPFVIVGSPPRADWCGLNTHVNHPRVDLAEVAERMRHARTHLGLVVKFYISQLER
eukprot:10108296-Alexandrium_andersonii.AAC.1